MSTTKAQLRQRVRETLRQWPETQRRASDAALVTQLLDHPWVDRAQTILLYWGVGTEVDTRPVLQELLRRGKTLCLPKCLPNRAMVARQVEDLQRLVPGVFGIPEPETDCPDVPAEKVDLIIVPGLVFDRQGYRLGQGGGYYDRYLEHYTGKTLGLARKIVAQEAVPREAFDRPVDGVLWDE